MFRYIGIAFVVFLVVVFASVSAPPPTQDYMTDPIERRILGEQLYYRLRRNEGLQEVVVTKCDNGTTTVLVTLNTEDYDGMKRLYDYSVGCNK